VTEHLGGLDGQDQRRERHPREGEPLRVASRCGHVSSARAGLIVVTRSHERDTPKRSRAEVIPIATELRPYLEEAFASSPSELVFPKTDGTRMRRDVALEDILRQALGRAGIVLRYEHVCRKRGCHLVEIAKDPALRVCPTHDYKLWPKAIVRQIRFHDLRHTTASLLMMAGANPAAVQRILRHRDPRITTEVYGHLAPDYLRAEVDRLRFFGDPAPRPREPEPARAVTEAETAQEAERAAARRRSTVREKVSFLVEAQPAAPAPVSHTPPAEPAPAPAPAPQPAAEPTNDSQPRRAGWWSRRFGNGE